MRCPATQHRRRSAAQPACTGRWNIWEYDMTTGGLTGGTFRRITASTGDDDVDPVYLPAGQGYRVHVEPPDQVEASTRRSATATTRSTSTSASACSTCTRWRRRQQHHADLVQPEPRPQPDDPPERRHHVLALGPRRRPQPLQGLHASSRTAPTCSCCTARTATATASCTRATWTRTASTPASSPPT